MINFKDLKKETLKGFTLIELLVVIAIIAILAAILFPVFAQAREKARQSTCLSNMKQMGLAVNMYLEDYDETYPPGRTEVAGVGTVLWTYYDIVYTYIKNFKVFLCPSSYQTFNLKDWQYYAHGMPYGIQGHYTANTDIMYDLYDNTTSPKTAGQITAPSDMVMIFEGSYPALRDAQLANNGAYYCWLPGAYLGNGGIAFGGPAEGLSDYKSGRHSEGINITYADGHAKFAKSKTVWGWVNTTSKNPFRPTTW